MMKIFKNRVGFNVAFLLLIGIIISPIMVDAKKSSSSADCRQALYPSDNPISFSYNNSLASVSIDLGEGTWDLYYYIEKLESNDDGDWSDVFRSNGKLDTSILHHTVYKAGDPVPSALASITRTKKSKRIFVFLALRDDNSGYGIDKNGNTLKVGSKNSTTCKSGSYNDFTFDFDTATISLASKASVVVSSDTIPGKLQLATISKKDNPHCVAMKEGKYYLNSEKSYLEELGGEALDAYNQQMAKSFPYCYDSGGSSYLSDISNATIKKVRQSSLKAFKAYYEFQKQKTESSKEFDKASQEIASEGYKKVDYKNKKTTISTLTCDKSATEETTQKYYTGETKKLSNSCKVQCQEQFQVIYDPPVATKAGLCFQYKVTVKTKVTCKVVQSPSINWPTTPETCGYVPICSNNANETQAGPNEEFDTCINSCDGGKYTQSCINSCYKKVYTNNKNSSTKKTSTETINSDTNSIQKLANSTNDPYYSIKGCKTNEQIKSNVTACAKEFYQLKQKYPAGYYTLISGSNRYQWNKCNGSSSKCKYEDEDGNTFSISVSDWARNPTSLSSLTPTESIIEQIKRASPYYFRSEDDAINLVQSFFAIGQGYNGFGGRRAYQIDNDGIKRQWTSGASSYRCYESCSYIKDGSASDSCATSSKEIEETLVEQFESIESSFAECTAAATCDEKKATFYIDVINNKTTDDETNKQSWEATNKSSETESEVNNKGSGDYEMFIPLESDKETIEPINGINGKCYARNNPSYWQHYKTTITFPGTWIDLKTGERKYSEPSADKIASYKEKKNYFCVGFDSEDVNIAWWDWKINNKGDINSITVEKDNNITADIDNFGKYNWNLSINCFYGLYSGVSPTCNDDDCPSIDEDAKCTDSDNCTTIDNYKFRIVDQENLFPSGKTGFNWTSAATDQTLKDSGSSYYVDPGEYAETTEATANEAYSGTPDYEVYLTKENLKDLKSYANANTYTNFGGTYPDKYIDTDGEGKTVSGFRAYEIDSNVVSKTKAFKRFTTIGVNNAGKK